MQQNNTTPKPMATKTAVQMIIEHINDIKPHEFVSPQKVLQWCEEALAFEKDQIVEAFNDGALDGLQLGEEYYNYVFNQ